MRERNLESFSLDVLAAAPEARNVRSANPRLIFSSIVSSPAGKTKTDANEVLRRALASDIASS